MKAEFKYVIGILVCLILILASCGGIKMGFESWLKKGTKDKEVLVQPLTAQEVDQIARAAAKTVAEETRKKDEERIAFLKKVEEQMIDKAVEKATAPIKKADEDAKKSAKEAEEKRIASEKAQAVLLDALREIRDRLEALEKAKDEPKKKAEALEGKSSGGMKVVQRPQDLLNDTIVLYKQWQALGEEDKALAAKYKRLSPANTGELGELPRENPHYKWSPVDVGRFDASLKRSIVVSKEEQARRDAEEEKRYEKRKVISAQRVEINAKRKDLARQISAKYFEAYQMTWYYPQLVLARQWAMAG